MSAKNLDSLDHVWSDIGASHESLHGAVTNSLREAILGGQFKPGDRLTESGLATMFDVSRNPIREALRALQVEGLVEINPRKGARVRLVSSDEVAEIIELRAELEGINARNAARRCDEKTRLALEALLAEGEKAAQQRDHTALKKLNNAFHELLADAGRNRYLADYVRTLRERTLWIFSAVQDDRVLTTWDEHAAILRAVIAADAELSSLLASRHVRRVGETVQDSFSEGSPVRPATAEHESP